MSIVLCHGKFDVLHTGHLFYFEAARKLGDRLVVSLTADSYLPNPPYFNEQKRKRALELLSWIDEVYVCEDKTGIPAIEKYQPDIYVKGPDYVHSCDEALQQEKKAVEKHGGRLEIVHPEITFSSTKTKNIEGSFVNIFDVRYKISLITDFIVRAKNLKVCVVGETIVDAFQVVELDGQSAKSSCPSFTIKSGIMEQQGGAAVIKRHLENFCASVDLHTNTNTIRKLRYVDRFSSKKHFEIKTINSECKQSLHLDNDFGDLTLVADFGHGLLDGVSLKDGIYLVVQTNSSNFSYNPVDKWNKYKSKLVCFDRVEGSLLIGEKFESVDHRLMQKLYARLNTKALILTMHKYGSVYCDEKGYVTCPALAQHVVDTIGAGDAFFTFASLAHHLGFLKAEMLLIASIAAAITTQWLCNEQAVTPQKLLAAAKVIL